MTPEEVRAMIQEELGQKNETIQWIVRSAFEEGWRLGGGSPERSPHYEQPKGWRLAWMNSQARNILVRNGMISGSEEWK